MANDDLPPFGALTTSQAADRLKRKFKLSISERTLRALHAKGEGPPRYEVGGRVYYCDRTCDAWALSQFKIDISFRASDMVAA